MKKKSLRFLCLLLGVAILTAALLSAAAFIIDPQNVYRWNTAGKRFFQPIYSAAGSIAHYDYDTLIIGSSMVQNWDAQTLARALQCKPLKVTVGAMTPNELLYLYDAAQKAGKATRFVINLDLHRIAAAKSIQPDAGRFPAYQFDPKGLTQFQYLLGFTTWIEFIPTDVFFTVAPHFPLPASLRSKIGESTDINTMCRWSETPTMTLETWQETLENGEHHFNEGDSSQYTAHYAESMEALLQALQNGLRDDQSVTLFLPPYSMLYWYEKTPKQLEILLALRLHLAKTASQDARIDLIDMQWIEETEDFRLYVDANHSGETVRKKAEQAIIRGEYRIESVQAMETNNAQIRSNLTKQ